MKRFYPYNMVALMACLVIGLFVFHRVSTSQSRINPPEETTTAEQAATENTLPTVPAILPTEPTPEEPPTTETDPATRPPRITAHTLPTHEYTTEVPETPAESADETTDEETTEEPDDTTPYVPPTQSTTRYVPPTTRYTPPTMPFVTTVPIQTEEDYDFRGSVIVKYMTLDGEVLDEYTIKDLFETPYTTEQKEFSGYHFIGVPDSSAPTSGVIRQGALQVFYMYEAHVYEVKNAKEAAVGQEGYTGDQVCANCGHTIPGEVIPALSEQDTEPTTEPPTLPTAPNESSSDEPPTDTEPSETEPSETEPSSGETEPSETEPSETEPSETEPSETEPSETEPSETEPSTECPHASTHLENKKDATCSEAGYTGDTVCDSCGATLAAGETIPALGHNWEDVGNSSAASCTQEGYTGDKKCSRCGEIQSGESIPKTAHVPGEYTDGWPAGPGTTGFTGKRYCTICGACVDEGSEIPALPTETPPADTPADNPPADTP